MKKVNLKARLENRPWLDTYECIVWPYIGGHDDALDELALANQPGRIKKSHYFVRHQRIGNREVFSHPEDLFRMAAHMKK